MGHSFLSSLLRYGRWYLRALLPGRHDGAPLGVRRLLFLLVFPVFIAVQLLHWLALLLDEVFYPAYRQVAVRSPVFITGIPRSGTTALHRLLAADPGFTSVSAWEALLAPSICQRRFLQGLKKLDTRYFNGHGSALLERLLEKLSGDFDSVHRIRPGDAEEDYLWLLPAGSCFLLLLAFPYANYLEQVALLQRMAPRQRSQLLDYYHRLLQRHCYCHPGGRMLSKNAAFAGWPPYLAARYPDAVFILCVRRPSTALASQLSSLRPARRLFGTDPAGRATTARFSRLYREFFASLAGFSSDAPATRLRVLEQSDLRAQPAAVVEQLGAWLGLRAANLPAVAEASPGSHRYRAQDFGLDADSVDHACGAHYRALLAHPSRLPVTL